MTAAAIQVVCRLKTPRVESRRHLNWIRTLPCSVRGCQGQPVHAHHLTCGPEPKARSLKASDRYAVPLCARHHGPGAAGSLHAAGDERRWWAGMVIDPIALAEQLWVIGPERGRV